MAETYDYDLIVIGSGPGGYVAAIRAAQLGLRTAVIEKDKPGGVCLNIGCIPSKALIEQARRYREALELDDVGLKVDTSGFDYRKVFLKSRAAADKLSKGVMYLLKKNEVTFLTGTARFVSAHEVSIDESRAVSGRNILIATGSRPRELPGLEFDEKSVLSSTGILLMEKLPESLMILGAGGIGAEFGYVYNAFGVDVTIVEMLPRMLPLEDPESSEFIAKTFRKRGIRILTSTKAGAVKKKGGMLEVTLEPVEGKGETVKVEKLLVAVGRVPNSGDLALEQIGVQVDERGFIKVGEYYETAVSGVYAIGDVISTPLLAHLASKEGEVAVEHMAGHVTVKNVDKNLVPFATYCEPQVGSFGINEETAKKAGVKYEKFVFPYRGAGKSVAIEKPDGFVKILYAPDTKEILGAHIAGSEATEILHEILLAKKAELLPEDIATMIHAHPSLSETVAEAARGVEGWVIHI